MGGGELSTSGEDYSCAPGAIMETLHLTAMSVYLEPDNGHFNTTIDTLPYRQRTSATGFLAYLDTALTYTEKNKESKTVS